METVLKFSKYNEKYIIDLHRSSKLKNYSNDKNDKDNKYDNIIKILPRIIFNKELQR